MKTPEQVLADVRRRITTRWSAELAGEETAFPHAFPIGRPTPAQLKADYSAVFQLTMDWQEWARRHSVPLTYTTKVAAGGTRQQVPTHARIESLDQACAIVGDGWPERVERSRSRLAVLRSEYPLLPDQARMLRTLEGYSEVDFCLLLTVAAWLAADPDRVRGMTPRQVPIPGVHAKWLQAHEKTVCALAGLDELQLMPGHPSRIHFTYLDPAYRASGGRIYDSATVGDRFTPAYLPEVVVISENKDTAIGFPAFRGGISVEGVGRGGKTAASFDWLRDAPLVVYWGDMDRDGYEILDGYRADFGRDLESILMDEEAYESYEQFGTPLDRLGAPLRAGSPRPVPRLRPSECDVYQRLTDPLFRGHRRIEQERIPLAVALEHVTRLAAEK